MSVKDVTDFHPEHAKLKRNAELIRIMADEYDLKVSCKSDGGGEGSYLRKPLSQMRPNDEAKSTELYKAHVDAAFLPEHILSDSLEEMVGICFKEPPIMELTDKLEYLKGHANNKGDGLVAVSNEALRDLVGTGFTGIETDWDDDRVIIRHRPFKSFVNWRMNSKGYTMMVLSEGYRDDKGDDKEQRRHYSTEGDGGLLVVTVYRCDDKGVWAEYVEVDDDNRPIPAPTQAKGVPYDYIPIRIVRTVKPALLGIARTMQKGFECSANYYGMLEKFVPKVVLKAEKKPESLNFGYDAGVLLGREDGAEILQITDAGAKPLKEAMAELYSSAVDQGVKLVSESSKAESGDAIFLRNTNKQIKMDAVAGIFSREMEKALQVGVKLENGNADDVSFKLKVELVKGSVDIDLLKELREAASNDRLVKHEAYLGYAHSVDLVEIDKDDDGAPNFKKYINELNEESRLADERAESI